MNNRKKWMSVTALLLAAFLLMGPVSGLLPTRANAASSSEIQNQIEEMQRQQAELNRQILELENQLQDNLTEMEEMISQKSIIDQEIFLLHQQINNTNEMISAYNVLIADTQEDLEKAEARLEELNEQHRERIRAMEEEGSVSYWSVLFNANSFADFLDRLNMIQEIAAADRQRLDDLQEAADQVAQARAVLETERANLEQVQENLASSEASLLQRRTDASDMLILLAAQGEEYQRYLEECERLQEDLNNQIGNAQDDLEAARESEYWSEYWATYVPPTTTEPPTEPPYVPPTEEEWESPVTSSGWRSPLNKSSYVTSAFGMRWHPVHHEWRMHNGVDLAARQGDEIVAARSGVVRVTSYQHNGAGYYVSIDHGDGYVSVYMHMTHYIVAVGQHVEAGQVIGYVGSTGASTGPHLHFGISLDGTYVDPADYVDFS